MGKFFVRFEVKERGGVTPAGMERDVLYRRCCGGETGTALFFRKLVRGQLDENPEDVIIRLQTRYLDVLSFKACAEYKFIEASDVVFCTMDLFKDYSDE
jgi:hypothetical protein